MLSHITCQTPTRFIRVAWLSLQPKGDISFGLSDKTFISPLFQARQFVWNVYNRVTAEYEIVTDQNALMPVRNPHFTYHAPNYFHLKSDKARARNDEALFAGICEVPIVLHQQSEMPWIRATTSPLSKLRSAGNGWSKVPTNDLPVSVSSEDVSLKISVDFIRAENVAPKTATPLWTFLHNDIGLRIGVSCSEPGLATLSWFHSY